MFSQQQSLRRAQRRARQIGVTLIETMVTLGIAGTLAAIGVPSVKQFHDKTAVESQYRSLASPLRRARSEATKRGEIVTVCALDARSLSTNEPACLERGKDWSAGWLVFVDRGERGELGEGDRVVLVHEAPANSGAVIGTQRYLSYRASGELLSIAAHFRILPPGQPAVDEPLPGSLLVCVNKPGKARVSAEDRCDG